MSAMTRTSFGISIRTGLIAVSAFAAVQSFATPASAGLLDFLFGGGRPQQQMIPAPQMAPAGPAKPVRRVVRDAPSGPKPYVAPPVAPGPLGRFVHDPSLRRGDVVATPNGLMVFQGRAGSTSHRASDFVPVGSAPALGSRRNDLLNLDRTVRATPANVEFVAEKAEPKPLVIAKRAENDARGAVSAD